jgi:hypothetical protein
MNFWRIFWSGYGFPLLLPHIPPPSWSIALQIRSNQFNHRVSIDFRNMDIILHVGKQGIYNLTIMNNIENFRLCCRKPRTLWRSSFENISQLTKLQLVKMHQKGYLLEREKECGMLLLMVMKVGGLLHLVLGLTLTSWTISFMRFFLLILASIPFTFVSHHIEHGFVFQIKIPCIIIILSSETLLGLTQG